MTERNSAGDAGVLQHEAQALRKSAERLLVELRLVEQWQRYGEVELAGSYRWDLMLGSDIDLNVVNPAADLDLALSIFNGFVRGGDFLAFAFIDSVRGKPAWADPVSYPEGYYIGMARHFEGREWKVETWLRRSPAPREDWLEAGITDEQRVTILELKQMRNSGHLKASSYDICRAVILGGARDAAAAREWLRKEQEAKVNVATLQPLVTQTAAVHHRVG
jgi:hypothetical protein